MPDTIANTETERLALQPTRSAAHLRLAEFLPSAGRAYAQTRNVDFGPGDRSNVSVLSPYIRHRLLLETEVLDAVLGRFALSTAEKFVQEVFWRTYFKGYLEQHPSIWRDYSEQCSTLLAEIAHTGNDTAATYQRAIDCRTGIDCFDAWAHELVETGYLHNHTRMWFASIWIHTLGLPWQLGADFFLRHLADGDPASNTLSWRWVGGLHTRGKIYLARPGNIEKYTNGRFAPHGRLATSASPLDETVTHPRRPIPEAGTCPASPFMLLLTEEDCSGETLPLTRKPTAAIACLATADRSPAQLGTVASMFALGAVEDAANRAAQAFGLDRVKVCEDTANWADEIRTAADASGVRDVVTANAPVGPVADRIAKARIELEPDGIRVHELRRSIDDIAWPHAGRGFFALKKKIPDILEDLARDVSPRLL